jgi:hypothetical protein
MCRWFRIDFRGWPKLSWIGLYYIRLLLSLCLTAINLDEYEVIFDCSRKLILSDPTFTEIIIQLHCIQLIEFLHSMCVLYTSPMIVNVCSILNNAHLWYLFLLEGVRQLIMYLLTFSSLYWNFWVQPLEWFSCIWCNNKWIWMST